MGEIIKIEVPKNLLSYWIDLVFDELHVAPSDNLLILYKSLNGIYLKHLPKVIKE